jgi:hypothetical protein
MQDIAQIFCLTVRGPATFGYSNASDHQFNYTFNNLLRTIQVFIDKLVLKRFVMDVFSHCTRWNPLSNDQSCN